MATPVEKNAAVIPLPGALPVPYSLEAEEALLGALLLNNQLLSAVDDFLRPDHFYKPAHAQLYSAIHKLIDRSQVADVVTVTDFLGSADWFKEMQGKTFLDTLVGHGSSVLPARNYGQIVYNHYLARQLVQVGQGLAQAASQPTPEADPKKLIGQTEQQLFSLASLGELDRNMKDLRGPLNSVLEAAHAARKRGTEMVGVASGFTDLDRVLGGLQNSDLIILAARPAMGKTSFALNMALHAAQYHLQERPGGAPVGVFSLEMSAEQLAARLLSSLANVSATDIQRGKFDAPGMQNLAAVASDLSETPIYIDDSPMLTIDALRSRARRLKRLYNVGLLVVDYLQLIRGPNAGKGDNRVQEITEISLALKSIARELNVPVIALSQLSRAVESRDNKRPQLSDLRESGSIEQDADLVMFLYRDDYYLEKEIPKDQLDHFKATVASGDEVAIRTLADKDKQFKRYKDYRGLAELIIGKNRKGATSTIQLVFDGPTTTFRDYSGPNNAGY